jgi:hypothetical protein
MQQKNFEKEKDIDTNRKKIAVEFMKLLIQQKFMEACGFSRRIVKLTTPTLLAPLGTS